MISRCDECSTEVVDSELRSVKGRRLCRGCAADAAPPPFAGTRHPVAIAGAVGVLLPLFFSYTTSGSMTVNGQVVSSRAVDYVQVAGGVVGLACAVLLALLVLRKKGATRFALPALLLAVGGLQLYRGLGLHQRVEAAPRAEPSQAQLTCTDDDVSGCPERCDAGDLMACVTLGVAYDNARGVPEDAARAAALFTRACDGGEGGGCHNLAILMKNERGGLRSDPAREARLREAACAQGWGSSCNEAGVHHDHGLGVEKNSARALGFFTRGCELEVGLSCLNQYLLLTRDRERPADPAAATRAVLRGCELGHLDGCHIAAVKLVTGDGVEKDVARALQLALQACEKGHENACSNVGVFYQDGVGVEVDLARAESYFQRACDRASKEGCALLAELRKRAGR